MDSFGYVYFQPIRLLMLMRRCITKRLFHAFNKAEEKYKEENTPVLPQIQEEKVNIQEPKTPEHQERLAKFMEKCEEERQAFIAKKEEAEKERLEKILLYTRNTLRPFDFIDEDLFQVCEAIQSLVIHRVVLTNIPIKIERTGKKTKLTNHD